MRLNRHDAALVVVSLIWGGNFTVTKRALAFIAPVPFAALRFVLSSALLLAAVRLTGRTGDVPADTRRRLLLFGVLGHALNQIAFVGGLQYTTATNSALIFAAMPVVVALMGAALGHERPDRRTTLAIALAAAGVALVAGARGVSFSSETLKGDLITMVAVLLWAAFTVGVRWAARGVGSLQVTMWTHLGATPGLLLLAAPSAGTIAESVSHVEVWAALLYSAGASSLIAAVLWTRSLQALGGNRTALYSGVTPIFAGAIAWAALGEKPVPLQGLGALLVISAVLLSALPALKKREEPA
ncbi:MAG: DMT family transporter [Gemmatimonadales bacterium]